MSKLKHILVDEMKDVSEIEQINLNTLVEYLDAFCDSHRENTPSSPSVAEEASRLVAKEGDGDGKSQFSMARSNNQGANLGVRGIWGEKQSPKSLREERSEM